MLQPQMLPQEMQMPSPWVGMPAQMPQQMDPAMLEQMQQQQNPMLAYMTPDEAAAKAESLRNSFHKVPKPTPTPKPVDDSASTLRQRMIDNVKNYQKGKRR